MRHCDRILTGINKRKTLKSIAHFSITTPTDVTHIINVTCPDVSDKQTVGAPVDAAAARYTRLKTVDFSSD